MSAVVAGMTRGVAEVIDGFLRLPPMGVEMHRLTGYRVHVHRDEISMVCDAEAARIIWNHFEDVVVDVRQYMIVEGVKYWSEEQDSGVKRAGGRFPPHHQFASRWRGRGTTVDAEFTVSARVPVGRVWEHRRWVTTGGLAAILEPPPEAPAEHSPLMLRGEEVAEEIRRMAVLRR